MLTPCLACEVATYCTRLVHCFLVLLPSFTCRPAVTLPVVTLPRLHSSQGLGSSQAAASRQSRAVIFKRSSCTTTVSAKAWCPPPPSSKSVVDCVSNALAHAQKPDFVFRWNGRVNLNRRGRQFSRPMAAEVCASAVVMLDTPCS